MIFVDAIKVQTSKSPLYTSFFYSETGEIAKKRLVLQCEEDGATSTKIKDKEKDFREKIDIEK